MFDSQNVHVKLEADSSNSIGPYPVLELKVLQQGSSTSLVAAVNPTMLAGPLLGDCTFAKSETYTTNKNKPDRLSELFS